jgi:translocation and assembly module TamB
MRRGLKIAAWSLGGLVALLALLVLAILVIGNTDSGRNLAIRATARLTKGQVLLSGIHGSFPSALDLDRLELRDDRGVWLFAERVSLRWSPLDLLTRHVKVDTLHVGRLHIERRPLPSEKNKPSSSPSIPHVDLADLTVDRLELGKELAGDDVSLVVHGSAHLRSLEDATAHVVARRTGGNGDYELQIRFDPRRMDGSLKLQEPANGPLENLLKVPGLGALSVSVQLNGPRNAESVQVSVDAGPLRGRARGTVDLVKSAADLDYSLVAPRMAPFDGLGWESVDLRGKFHGPFTRPTADGHLLVKSLYAPGGTALSNLTARLTASAGHASLDASVDGLSIPGPQPSLLKDSPLTLSAAVQLDDPARPLRLKASHKLFSLQGTALTAGKQSAQLELRLPDVAPLAALGGQKVRGDALIEAHAKLSGSTTTLNVDVSGNLDGGDAAWAGLIRGGATRLQLAGDLTDRQISIDKLQLTGPAISVAGSGTAGRTETQEVNARVELSLPDLAKASTALNGTLKLTGTVKGPLTMLSADTDVVSKVSVRGSPTGTVSATVHAQGLPKSPRGTIEAHGDLDGAPLRLNAALQLEKGDVYRAMIQQADFKSAHADGDVTTGTDFAEARGGVRFRVGDLSDFDRLIGNDLRGSISGNLTFKPDGGKTRAGIDIDAKDIQTGGISANAQLAANGTLDALNIKLGMQSPAVAGTPLNVNSTALLDLTAKQLRLQTLEADYHEQQIRLQSPAKLSFADGFRVEGLKVGAQQAVLEFDGRITPALDARASLRQVKPELINAFVPNLLASGTIQADAEVKGSIAEPTGKAHLEATGLRAANDAARGLPLTDVHADAALNGTSADVDAQLEAGKASRLALSGRAPLSAVGALDLKLVGNLDIGLLNPLLEAGGRHVTGTLAIDTTVTGAAADPEIGGTVRIAKGSLRDYRQGVNLSDITGELTGSHGLLRIEKLTARAAPGDVAIEGTIGVLQPKIPVDLKLTAKNAQPIANNIVTANVDADMQVTGTAREQLEVGGTIRVNRADVEIPNGLPPNVAVLDVRRPGQKTPPKPEKPLVIKLNINVDAPRRILVKGRGLDAELGGEIRIRGTSEEPRVGGGFELQRGFFTLASSKLTFSNGTVTFSGTGLKNRIDPTLDFTASTQVVDVTATIRITGLADSPKIELSSTPDLPQDEILARLLFGQSAAQLSALQVVQIGAALATLSGGGGGSSLNPVARIQKALGLDRLSVGSATTTGPTGAQQNTGASIEAGRYVSSRVFVAVKESTTGASQLVVDVDLTRHLKIQTKLGNGSTSAQGTTPENDPGSSVGLAYQFEY